MKVLYIIGKGRSGSTLLDVTLNSIPGFFSTGEIWRRWDGRVFEDYVCGCGKAVGDCVFWTTVLQGAKSRVTGSHQREVTSKDVLEWERTVSRWHNVPYLIGLHRGGSSRSEVRRLADFMIATYREIIAQTGVDVIVDSSKWPANLGPLGLLPGVEPYIVHLVRDARAVAYSWRRPKSFLPDGTLPMPTFGPIYSAASWIARNLVAELVARRQPERVLRIRYEDFVHRPRHVLSEIVELLAVGSRPLPNEGVRTLLLEPNHTMWGNKSRFQTGRVPLRRDMEWQKGISSLDAFAVTVLTAPLLRRYGYKICT